MLEILGVGLRFMAKALIAMSLLGICLFVIPNQGLGLIAWLMVMAVWVRSAIHWRACKDGVCSEPWPWRSTNECRSRR